VHWFRLVRAGRNTRTCDSCAFSSLPLWNCLHVTFFSVRCDYANTDSPSSCSVSSASPPYSRAPPTWLKTPPANIAKLIIKLSSARVLRSARSVFRDSQIISLVRARPSPFLQALRTACCLFVQVRFVAGNKILRILKSYDLAPGIPEDPCRAVGFIILGATTTYVECFFLSNDLLTLIVRVDQAPNSSHVQVECRHCFDACCIRVLRGLREEDSLRDKTVCAIHDTIDMVVFSS